MSKHRGATGPAEATLEDWAPTDGRPSRSERRARGKQLRKQLPFADLGRWEPAADRPDPIDLLQQQATTRLPDLVPIRYGRMMASPFAYYRGTPIVMAHDLGAGPRTDVIVQACGDAHVLNFGLFASPERNLIFDVNDFDETLPAPWEWDVKRLVASLVIAARELGLPEADQRDVAEAAVRSYVRRMAEFATMGNLEIWYARVGVDNLMPLLTGERRARAERTVRQASQRTSVTALPKLTEVVDGQRRIIDDPPLITHPMSDGDTRLVGAFEAYRQSLPADRQALLDHYQAVDVAQKVVGVGSVGTRCLVMLMVGADGSDPLFLQVKEAERSVLEPHTSPSTFAHQGERVVVGQRLMQAASDVFLGWTQGVEGRHFYVRQLRDMKGSFRIEHMDTGALRDAGATCAWTLARAHARSGDAPTIAGYAGKGDGFATALGAFAAAYADQIEADHQRFREAINRGRIFAIPGL